MRSQQLLTSLADRLSRLRISVAGSKDPILTILAIQLAFVLLLTACGGSSPGGSGGNPPPSIPAPAISALTPNSATAGGAAFTISITGQNFTSSSTVYWNQTSLATTYNSSTQLQAQITAADISNAGSATVSVVTPAPGGGNSGEAEFTINPTSNPTPTVASLSPPQVNAGSSSFDLVVNGTNFLPNSTIVWNGTNLSTAYLSETQLEAQIPAANVATPGFADITVVNPAPGGGSSAPTGFGIAASATVINQLANDLVWDSTNQLIYLSVPSLAGSNGNSISVLNPARGTISSSQFAGSEPDLLAISGDNSYLYVGMDGSSSVQRYTLPGLQLDTSYLLGSNSVYGPYFAWDLQVAPGLPHTTAIARSVFSAGDTASEWDVWGGLAIYDDAIKRPTVANGSGNIYSSIQWASDATIYANNGWDSSFDLYDLAVSSNGVVQTKDYLNVFTQFYISIHYDAGTGFIYGDDGTVVNPTNGQNIGSFQASGLMIPDSAVNSAFFLGQTPSQIGSTNFTLESFNQTTLAPIAEVAIAGVQGTPLRFIQWGANGFAFNDDAGYIYILNSPFTAANGARVVTPSKYLNAVQKKQFIPKSLRRSNTANPLRSTRVKRNLNRKQAASASVTPNPAPAIAALSPSSVALGAVDSNGFTLTVTGSNFVSLSTVEWNGASVPTEFVSTSELQAQITYYNVGTTGSISVNVATPSPGGGSSNTLPFTVTAAESNTPPLIVSLNPNSVIAGSSGFTLQVQADSATSSSVVEWNGTALPISNVGTLQVQIPAADVATPGYAQITVVNPGPGGGSSTAEFQILDQSTVVNQVTNDIVWDPLNQVIYISVPGSAATHANQVCILHPASATIGTCVDAGSEPDVLAISDDSQFLYVGEDTTGTVQRFILPALTPDISFSLGNYENGEPYYALDLQVAPGAPHTTAVTKGAPDIDPIAEGGITIYDDSTPRPVSAPGWSSPPSGKTYDSIQWGANATELYASNTEGGNDFFALTVNSSGVTLTQDVQNMFWNPGRIHYDEGNGFVYADDGYHAVNPAICLPAGIFEVGGGWPMAPDSAINTVFILSQYDFQENSNYTVNMFDMTTYLPVSQIPFSTPQGISQLGRFIRWGTNGLAVNDMAGNIYLISGALFSAEHMAGKREH
jgi:trimeric autotransporter adhesin